MHDVHTYTLLPLASYLSLCDRSSLSATRIRHLHPSLSLFISVCLFPLSLSLRCAAVRQLHPSLSSFLSLSPPLSLSLSISPLVTRGGSAPKPFFPALSLATRGG